ncbi:MAG: hypothetical protein M3511_07155, partial [Deinococcota bacterium]|nr:hypothetical protein [Deinococcota bacterium]
IWYTGDQQGFSPNTATISQTDELNLQAYLDQDNRKVIAFSPGYLRPYSDRSWDAISNTFINTYLGATMGRFDFNDNNLTVSGTADTVTAGVTLQVAGSDAIRAYTSVLEPAEGTATLLTTPLDPDGSGTVRAIAIATGRQSVGAAATSTIVFAGFAFENIVDIGPNNKQALMGRLLDY